MEIKKAFSNVKNIIKSYTGFGLRYASKVNKSTDGIFYNQQGLRLRSAENELHQDFVDNLRNIINSDPFISQAMRIICNKANSFKYKLYTTKTITENGTQKDIKEYVSKDHYVSKILNKPNSSRQKNYHLFTDAFLLNYYVWGTVYFMYNKLTDELTLIERSTMQILEINNFASYTMERIPQQIRFTIMFQDKNQQKVEVQTYYYNQELGLYQKEGEENLFLIRINDLRFQDTDLRYTSVITSCAAISTMTRLNMTSQIRAWQNSTKTNILSGILNAFKSTGSAEADKLAFLEQLAGVENHGKTKMQLINSNSESQLQTFEIDTTPKNKDQFEFVRQGKKLIFSMLGVPEQLADGDNSHYNAVDQMNLEFTENTGNLLNKIYNELITCIQIAKGKEKNEDRFIKYEVDELSSSAILDSKINMLSKIESILSINERRQMIGLDKLEGEEYNKPQSQLGYIQNDTSRIIDVNDSKKNLSFEDFIKDLENEAEGN